MFFGYGEILTKYFYWTHFKPIMTWGSVSFALSDFKTGLMMNYWYIILTCDITVFISSGHISWNCCCHTLTRRVQITMKPNPASTDRQSKVQTNQHPSGIDYTWEFFNRLDCRSISGLSVCIDRVCMFIQPSVRASIWNICDLIFARKLLLSSN